MQTDISKKNVIECAEDAISLGGIEFIRWMHSYISENIKEYRNILKFVVAAVPQIGDNTGKLFIYPKEKGSELGVQTEVAELFNGLLANVYKPNIEISKVSQATDISILRCPIIYGFGKPIGSVFIIADKVDNEFVYVIKSLIDGLSFLARSVKVQIAFRILSENLLDVSGDTEHISLEIIDNARKAIGSKDIGLWRVTQENKLLEYVVGTRRFNADMDVGSGLAGTCVKKGTIIKIEDLLDKNEVRKYCATGVEHEKLVLKMGWHSAIFIPISAQKYSAGVFAVYSGRKAGLNDLDYLIARAFASQIEYAYTLSQTEKLVALKKHLTAIAPAMDAAIDAVGNLHDADDELIDALNSISLLEDSLPNTPSDYLKAIKSSIKQASSLLKKFKDDVKFSKTNKLRVKFRNVKKEIEQVVIRTRVAASAQNIEFAFSCPDDISCEFDAERIKRAIRNVLENSIDFLKMSKIKPKTIYLGIRLSDDQKEISFTIEDNGPGIDPSVKDSIFDIFFTTKDEEGFGLGLNMTDNTIKAHKGRIDVDTRTGKGSYTKIIMTIPVHQ